MRSSVAFPKDPSAVFARRWMRQIGFDPKDVDWIYIGATPERYAALISGVVQATSLTQPHDMLAQQAGYIQLADFADYAKDYGFIALFARRRSLQENPDVARGYLLSLSKAIDWLYQSENKEEAIKLMELILRQSPAVMEKLYDFYFNTLKPFNRGVAVPESGVKGVLETIVEMGDMRQPTPPASKYLDTSFMPRT